jgi:hypothetical protein
MFPHERSLVAKMKDEPFALIGVNSDKNYKDLKQKQFVEEKITWRSFTCGEKGTMGPIPTQWGVTGWPSIFLIDAQGVLRNHWLGSPGEEVLDKAIEDLVAEAKTGEKAPAAPAKKEGGKAGAN